MFLMLSLLPLLAAVTSCSHSFSNDIDELPFKVKAFSVSGTVYDSSESIPGVPLEDIMVSITAYWYYDTDRAGEPLFSAVMRTSSDGRYVFSTSWNMTMQNVYFVIKVTDDSKRRNVRFKPIEQELYMRPHTEAYDDVTMSYSVRDNDFYMLPES